MADARQMEDRLTARQEAVLRCIGDYVGRNEKPPTLQELCAMAGNTNSRNGRPLIDPLIRKGYISREAKRASRNLRITEKGKEWLRSLPLQTELPIQP